MRQLSTEDLHRLILEQAADPATLDPWSHSKDYAIFGRLKLRIDDEVENKIVSSVIGSLTYRNREHIRRLLNRLARWPSDSAERNLDMLDYWASIGEKYFDYVETFYVKPTLFEAWRRQMHAADEDLPALAWLCRKTILPYENRQHHEITLLDQWPTFIRGNDPQLYRELAKGYACLHLHLSGAYPAPYFWLGLMNKRFDEQQLLDNSGQRSLRGYRSINDLNKLVELITLARTARSKLLKFVSGINGDEVLLQRKLTDCEFLNDGTPEDVSLEKPYTDQAQCDIRNWDQSVCPSLIGERYLLMRILKVISRSEDDDLSQNLSRIFWAYIVAKHAFLGTVQQAEGIAGFDYFEHTFRMVKWRTADQENICAKEIGCFLQESGSLVKLEIMIAPKETINGYSKDIELAGIIQKQIQDRQLPRVREQCGQAKAGLIVHFIKDHGEPLNERLTKDGHAYKAYHHGVRDRTVMQLETLLQFLKESDRNVSICGIDAANRELYCPPEIFSEAFRRSMSELRRRTNGRLQTIGRTFHVGEDFAHLITGLRRIYEALVFLDLRPGDRLGHACALGIDPIRWAMTNPVVEMHLIDILDDAIFEVLLLRYQKSLAGKADERRISELTRVIDECCVEIYGSTIPLVHLEKAWHMRAQVSRNKAETFGCDASVPDWIKAQDKEFPSEKHSYDIVGSHSLLAQVRDIADPDDNLPVDSAERVASEYLYDKRTIQRFMRIRPISTANASEYISMLQSIVAEEVNQRGIVIESNPSSNWLIGGLESHTEIPAVRWLTETTRSVSRVPFTINPDDPTVFACSIENEYFMVFAAATHSLRAMSRSECLREISVLREKSLQASFLD